LYNWETAMNGAASSNAVPSGVQGVCPEDWHLPSYEEWTTLVDYAGGPSTAGAKLKSTDGWRNNGNGTDDYRFSALPGGSIHEHIGDGGYWWSATEDASVSRAYSRQMDYHNEFVKGSNPVKTNLLSVRCVKNAP